MFFKAKPMNNYKANNFGGKSQRQLPNKSCVHLKILTQKNVLDFFYLSKKVWDKAKCLFLCFLLHKISKKNKTSTTESQLFSMFFWKNIEKVWDIEKCLDSVIFCLHFSEFCYKIFLCAHTFSKFLDGHA